VRVKVCGITRAEDAVAAEAAGADAIGLVFAPSRRRVDERAARDVIASLGPFVTVVGVFRDQPLNEVIRLVTDLGLDVAQLHGEEDAAYAAAVALHARVVRAVAFERAPRPDSLDGYPAHGLMLDAAVPGSGTSFAWDEAQAWRGHPGLILAGGLTPGNVQEAIRALAPSAVDVSTGVENAPGEKDHDLVRAFVRAAHAGGSSVVRSAD